MSRLFYSYSHLDEAWCNRLVAHLRGLRNQFLVEDWYDRRMRPGDDFIGEISEHLDKSDIIILLVSANYFASDFCMLEAERAMELRKLGRAEVIPVMLRHYNLSGAVFAHLTTYPPANRPIDSDEWPDKELALRSVSEEVEKLARKMTGAGPKHKLLHLDREELGKLLHHLCDRSPQYDALHQSLHPERRKPRRPFVVIMQGSQSDSLEWFLDRLQNLLVPRLLGAVPGRLSPFVWPEFEAKKSPADLFGPRLVDCLAVSPYAGLDEINRALTAQNAMNILPSSLPAGKWASGGELAFNEYLRLWDQWPMLLSDYALIPVLAIEYPAEDSLDERISSCLSAINFASRPNLGGVVLPPMGAVEHSDFKNWIRHERVRTKFVSPEKAVEKSDELHAKTFPTPMRPLAERHLPQFLERL